MIAHYKRMNMYSTDNPDIYSNRPIKRALPNKGYSMRRIYTKCTWIHSMLLLCLSLKTGSQDNPPRRYYLNVVRRKSEVSRVASLSQATVRNLGWITVAPSRSASAARVGQQSNKSKRIIMVQSEITNSTQHNVLGQT
jgi:hypothetical protein